MRKIQFALIMLWCSISFSQSNQTVQVAKFVQQNQQAILNEFAALLSIPNVASDSLNIHRNAEFIAEMMRKRNISNVQLLTGLNPAVPPVVYGEVPVAGAQQTIIFYAHYDGQPVNPA